MNIELTRKNHKKYRNDVGLHTIKNVDHIPRVGEEIRIDIKGGTPMSDYDKGMNANYTFRVLNVQYNYDKGFVLVLVEESS